MDRCTLYVYQHYLYKVSALNIQSLSEKNNIFCIHPIFSANKFFVQPCCIHLDAVPVQHNETIGILKIFNLEDNVNFGGNLVKMSVLTCTIFFFRIPCSCKKDSFVQINMQLL